MKFQDSSFNGLKVTVGTKSVTHPRTHPPTHAPKAICPINFFKVGGIISCLHLTTFRSQASIVSKPEDNGPVNAHLIYWPSKTQNMKNQENIW